MAKPNGPPPVWGKLIHISNGGARLNLRTNVTQRYGLEAVTDFHRTYGDNCGRFVFEPHEENKA